MSQEVDRVSPEQPAAATLSPSEPFVDRAGRRGYRIDEVSSMAPFLMSLTSATDVWAFFTSTGGVTAGRRHPDAAIFPYVTEDKLVDTAHASGSRSVVRVPSANGPVLWEPLHWGMGFPDQASSALVKSDLGDVLLFEETRPDLGLRWREMWRASQRFGLVREVTVDNLTGTAVGFDVLDGCHNILPSGASAAIQGRLSPLLDAYKQVEYVGRAGVSVHSMSAGLTDLAEANESLRATVAWHAGLATQAVLLGDREVDRFRRGLPLLAPARVRGERGAHLALASVTLEGGATSRWVTVLDTGLDGGQVSDLIAERADAGQDVLLELDRDAAASAAELRAVVGASDGLQRGGDEVATTHHAANVLFNVMRGGMPSNGYAVQRREVLRFIGLRNRPLLHRHRDQLQTLPDTVSVPDLRALADQQLDPDLRRLLRQVLPLTFSRRHGDPSRPWNRFDIKVTDARGQRLVDYQGNWRDIFQNWEALAWSFPELLEGMVLTFLDAITVDGYNPYRITYAGIDWEVPEADNPWANIGYWSDHQIVYLARLLGLAERFAPGRLARLVDDPSGVYADVPYRIAGYDDIVANPVDTITFLPERDRAARDRAARIGGDGLLACDASGELLRATMGEKLLLLLCAKLVNLVPLGGVWMTTQRPEWNDANNALVGRGLSVVTVAQLLGFLDEVRPLLRAGASVSTALAHLVTALTEALDDGAGLLESGSAASIDPVRLRDVTDALGHAGAAFRSRVYRQDAGPTVRLDGATIGRLLDLARDHAEATVWANRRPDGLFHSYNTVALGPGTAHIGRLQLMLEGQVAVLDSGLLCPQDAVTLLDALRGSDLYAPDRGSYLLYPDRELPAFVDGNRVSGSDAAAIPVLRDLAARGDRSVLVADRAGDWHFAGDIRNAFDVTAALDAVAARGVEVTAADREAILDVFEKTFHHHDFTGRSGRFFAYEGLGSIYWHMVGKLVLAASGQVTSARAGGADPDVVAALRRGYEELLAGLGFRRSALEYGAFPTDPYSHTPGRGSGARQPGMTGQVKEAILVRWGQLGIRVADGRLSFDPVLLPGAELGDSGSLDFTFCGVPVTYRRATANPTATCLVQVRRGDAVEVVELARPSLPHDLSAAVFRRSPDVLGIEVFVPAVI
jgi:hypothetical protein